MKFVSDLIGKGRYVDHTLILCGRFCGKRHHKYRPADLHPMVNLHGGRQRSLLGCGVPRTAPGDIGVPRAPASPLGRRSCKRESSVRSGNHHVLSVSRQQRLGKKTYMGSVRARARAR